MRRFWTPLLKRVYAAALIVLVVFECSQAYARSAWHRERLYRQLLSGPRPRQILAARELSELSAQDQLIRALKTDSPYVRRLATQGLWNIWLHAAGDRPFRCTEAASAAVNGRDYPKALAILNKLVDDYPQFAEGWNRRATLFWMLGQYELSIFDCEKVVALNPSHYPAWQGMGLSQLQLKDFRGAAESLRTALRINPYDEQARELLRLSEKIVRRMTVSSDADLLRI